ncbi:MAG: PDZ domain-containing protein [Ruminococcus sp.]|nr:PDZ domain-containing protein [Ruminococcus sp.]
MKIDLTRITYGFFGACAVAGLTYLGVTKYYEKEISFGEKYGGVINAMEDIDEFYYKNADKETYERNMVSGLLEGLGDTYTFCTDNSKSIENSVNGSMQMKTAGFKVGKDSATDNIVITEVVPESYAEKLGLRENDLIVSIDGKNVRQVGYDNILRDLLGKSDTTSELVVERGKETINVKYSRSIDEERFLPFYKTMLDNSIMYYRFSSFDEGSAVIFKSTYDSYSSDEDIKGIILDLRENAGGEIPEAINFFDYFTPSGSHVVCEYPKSDKKDVYKTTDDVAIGDVNVVVLVSEDTLSCGEILAGLFSSTGRGTVVGTQTGGKGVFQTTRTLSNMTSYSIVSGYYYVNDLQNFDKVGITPDVVVDMEKRFRWTDDDIQLEKAKELLS